MRWLERIFPVQSREAEMEETVQTCINKVVDSDFSIREQAMIVEAIGNRFQGMAKAEADLLKSELEEYQRVLGLI